MNKKLYPFKFIPMASKRPWGGSALVEKLGKVFTEVDEDGNESVIPANEKIGESWELSGVKGNESVVAEGALAGKTVAELCAEYKGQLLGEKVYAKTGAEFPLLVKFIDARDDLSIQVHPDDALAGERHNGSKGKTEMWYVVQADEKAHLMSGLTKHITPEEYAAKVEDNTITDVLHDYNV